MKFRVHSWVDTSLGEQHFGIQVRRSPTERWLHCVDGDQVILYKTLASAKAAVDKLRAKAKEQETAS